MLFSARVVAAVEAKEIGLIEWLVPAAELDDVVEAYANDVAAMSQVSTRVGKRFVRMIGEGAMDDDRETHRLFVDSFSGPDFKEGIAAFIHKRKPTFPVA
jgi:enoyl-CoA hydratase/carnithine racemase